MAFGAVTILMDTLHQHFLLPTPRFPLRNTRKVKLLYKNLSSLQTTLQQDFEIGENDEAIKALEAQIRDVSVELRFQIEHQLRLFYLGKSMKLRLHSAQKLLPILNLAKQDIESMDFGSMLDILWNHFVLPVWRMPPYIKKRVKSFWILHELLYYERGRKDKQDRDDEQESNDEQESDDNEQESDDEQENEDEQKIKDEWENEEETEDDSETELSGVISIATMRFMHMLCEQESKNEQVEDEWETEEEQNSDDKQESEDEQEINDKQRRWYMLCEEAESIITQELRAPSYLNKYMKQRIQARQSIRLLFMQGIKLTSCINKKLLKLKFAYHQPINSENNNIASLRGFGCNNFRVGDTFHHTSESTINMVGCDDEFNIIMDKLNQQSSKREIVSIVGMGGIGKTTLARRIYGDFSFISRFDCQAWATISQEYSPTKVLKDLLRSLAPGVHENNELAERVYKCLKGRRYFIVIDDIWSTDVLDDLMRCFQDDNNGSRMLLTTRLKNVADYAISSSKFCHTMRFLDLYESWNLFHNKLLPERITFSPLFEIIARVTVNKCKGLPLAIIVVAGLLSNSKQDLNEWERIAKNVHTLSLDHSYEQCENIIDLSYTFLPHHLKHCFLSMGCFVEDCELPEHLIIDFWVSEGFLKVLSSKSLEDVARESLQELVDRNLLIFREVDGGLSKVYQMHDVLRELALREAQKENLFWFRNDDCSIMSVGFRRAQLVNSYCTSQPWSFQSKTCSYNSLSHTFLSLNVSTGYSHTKQLPFHKFLRGLILREPEDTISSGYMFKEFMGLVHLRCLRSDCSFKLHSLPWFMLWNLQKLEVEVESIDEPLNIWGLPQLKNLTFHGGITLVPPRSVHHNLETIKILNYWSCTKELFVKVPNLKTLGVGEGHTINPTSNWFESLAYLYKLEELKVRGKLLHPMFRTIHLMGTLGVENFLPNLKTLKLFNTKLHWKDMFVVGMLSKLEVLSILENAVVGRKWEPKDGGFHQLKFLGISSCDLQCWKVTSGHFPVLECLVIGDMRLLKRIPSGFADIVTLKSIKLYSCLDSTISSAKRIQEEQREYGNNMFAVDILRANDFHDQLWV